MADFKGEKLVKENKLVKVYDYFDEEKKIRQLSREVYLKKDVLVHYPRGFEGGDKYNTIKKFTYLGFKGKALPIGVYKSESYGWGFTKELYPFADYINQIQLDEVIIEKGGKTEIDTKNKKLYLNEKNLELLQLALRSIYKKNRAEVDFVLQLNLHALFPKTNPKPAQTYLPDALANSLAAWGNRIEEFSDSDKKAITDLFDKLSVGTDFLTREALAKTKEIVDSRYIQQTIKKFKELIALKTDGDSLEKQWQEFLRDNSWIFSSIFAQPVILFQREAFVGGKAIDNTNGKFNDFLIKSSLSDNVSFIELKTHKTKLLENTAYRGNDVFSATKDLSGCVAQVLNQRDNFQKEFYAAKYKSQHLENFETFNSKCVVIIGALKDLTGPQKYSFELLRSNSRDVEIITFDELLAKIESLQKLMDRK